jgi:hypothetical protein
MISHDKTDVVGENSVRLKHFSHQISHTNDPGPNPNDRSHLRTMIILTVFTILRHGIPVVCFCIN